MFENIKYEQARASVAEFRKCATALQDIFDAVKASMNSMTSAGTYEGNASNALRTRFDECSKNFPNYVSKVNEFANVTEAAINRIKANEEQQQREINTLQG